MTLYQKLRQNLDQLEKIAFQPTPPMPDPAMQGAPVDPNTGMPMAPPMDPSMQGAPVDPNTGMPMQPPMDPAAQGAPPADPAQAGIPEPLVAALEQLGSALEQLSQKVAAIEGAQQQQQAEVAKIGATVSVLEKALQSDPAPAPAAPAGPVAPGGVM